MSDNPIRYRDLIEPDDSIITAVEQLTELNKQLSSLQKKTKKGATELEIQLKQTNTVTEEGREIVRKAATEADRLAAEQKKVTAAMGETAMRITELKKQQHDYNTINKLTARLNNSLEGSYDHLSAQYSLNKIKLNAMTEEYRKNTKEGQLLEQTTYNIYQKMKMLQESTGKHTLSVGDYEKSTRGLNMAMAQVLREAPAAAVSANTFFLAISNNLPILSDQIQALIVQNKALAAQGLKTKSVFGSVLKTFVSWNALMSIGVTLLTFFGGDIVKFIGNMVKSTSATTAAKDALAKYNEALRAGSKEAQKDLVHIKLLYNGSQDMTKSYNDRIAAVKALKKEYPKYFENFTDEEILAGKAASKYNELAKAILNSAKARAAEEKLIELSKQQLEVETKIQDNNLEQRKLLSQGAREAAESIEAVTRKYGSNSQMVQVAIAQNGKLALAWANSKQKAADLQKESDKLGKTMEELAKRVDIGALSSDPTKDKKKGKEPKDRTQRINEKNLDILKKYYESENKLQTDSFKQRSQAILNQTRAENESLKNKLENDKDLTEESKKLINIIIANNVKAGMKQVEELNKEEQLMLLNNEKASLQLRLDATEENTKAAFDVRMALLENQRKQEIVKNSQLIEELRQSEADINAKYDKQRLDETRSFNVQLSLRQFDAMAELQDSEFNLIKRSEDEKTLYRMKAEKERWQKILQLNSINGKALTAIERKTIQNMLATLTREINQQTSKNKTKDIYSLLGIKLDDESKNAINESVGFSIGKLNEILSAQSQIAQEIVNNAQKEVDAAKNRLDAEIEARNNGYANNVESAQKELALAKKNQSKAIAEQRKAQKAQEAINTLQQTSDLITASAKIWAAFGVPWLAIPAIALMWTTFTASKIKAAQLTRTQAQSQTYGEGGLEILSGGSHKSGNDIPIGHMPDGRERRAEGGEALAIINKKNTRKYRDILPKIVNTLNNGSFERAFLGAYSTEGLSVSYTGVSSDMGRVESILSDIKEQGDRRFYQGKNGELIEIRGNVKIIHK
ncbi:hypothetical protein PD691P4_00015 [Parabacteroides phage PD691P4]|nr:hypothetical protein PD691P4_00015 [Parabacteroides phage PD691P4]